MWRRLLATATSLVALLVLSAGVPPGVESIGVPECSTSDIAPVALNAIERENGCLDSADAADADADLKPARTIADAYPIFLGVAVDPDNNRVVMADSARKGLLTYDRSAGMSTGIADQVTKPLVDLRGSKTEIGFVAGVAPGRARAEKDTANNNRGGKRGAVDHQARGH